MSRELTPGDFYIAVEIQLPADQHSREDVSWFKAAVRDACAEVCPEGVRVWVVAGQKHWFDDNDGWSRAA